jgi:hypothetical protein
MPKFRYEWIRRCSNWNPFEKIEKRQKAILSLPFPLSERIMLRGTARRLRFGN